MEDKVKSLGSRSKNAQIIINYLFQRPVIDVQKGKELTNLSLPSMYKLIAELEKLQIIKEITGAKRGKLYLFEEYVELFN